MDAAPPLASAPRDALERFFGVREFRAGQEEAIEAVLAGEDTLVILATGSGKSVIYQVAALLLPGTVLVVSPLIALMRDQLADLQARDFPGVAALHSQVPESEQRAALAALGEGRLRLVYVTPERCATDEFLAVARRTRISLLAVDEAHCISEWGHDFRPEYQLLDDAARALGRPPILALTATATPAVREQIVERLELRAPRVIVRGFDRPNLFLEVYPAGDEREKQTLLGRLIGEGAADYPHAVAADLRAASAGRGIVYTALTRSARTLSQLLNRAGVHAAYYHGQLKASQRNAVQARFSDGSVRAIAATNAFGMGIDLPDLRFVVHYDPPPSLEAYYQEAGRAGRDGAVARCPLLFVSDDLGRAAFAGGTSPITADELERVAGVLGGAPKGGVPRTAVTEVTGLSAARALRALELLVATGAVVERRGRYRPGPKDPERIQAAVERETRRQAQERTKLEMVRRYAQVQDCRRRFLLQYFGEYDAPAACGMCDRCVPREGERERVVVAVAPPAEPAPDSPFQSGDTVQHDRWGAGVVQHVADDSLTVHFDEAGYRTLDLRTVLERNLLQSDEAAS